MGKVEVDDKIVDSNVPVTPRSRIKVASSEGMFTPTKEETRIWLYHKPRSMITSHSDPEGRETVFGRLKELGLKQHVISVGRLDYNSEGLLIITNDGGMARTLELPEFKVSRSYQVRVFGDYIDDYKLQDLKYGCTIDGCRYGPYQVKLERNSGSNTWLNMKLQ